MDKSTRTLRWLARAAFIVILVGALAPRAWATPTDTIAKEVASSLDPSVDGPLAVQVRGYGALPGWFDEEALVTDLLGQLEAGSATTEQLFDVVPELVDHHDAARNRADLARRGFSWLVLVELFPQPDRVDACVQVLSSSEQTTVGDLLLVSVWEESERPADEPHEEGSISLRVITSPTGARVTRGKTELGEAPVTVHITPGEPVRLGTHLNGHFGVPFTVEAKTTGKTSVSMAGGYSHLIQWKQGDLHITLPAWVDVEFVQPRNSVLEISYLACSDGYHRSVFGSNEWNSKTFVGKITGDWVHAMECTEGPIDWELSEGRRTCAGRYVLEPSADTSPRRVRFTCPEGAVVEH